MRVHSLDALAGSTKGAATSADERKIRWYHRRITEDEVADVIPNLVAQRS